MGVPMETTSAKVKVREERVLSSALLRCSVCEDLGDTPETA